MPIKLELLYHLSYLASTPKGDNRVEEQEVVKFCWLILILVVKMQGKF